MENLQVTEHERLLVAHIRHFGMSSHNIKHLCRALAADPNSPIGRWLHDRRIRDFGAEPSPPSTPPAAPAPRLLLELAGGCLVNLITDCPHPLRIIVADYDNIEAGDIFDPSVSTLTDGVAPVDFEARLLEILAKPEAAAKAVRP